MDPVSRYLPRDGAASPAESEPAMPTPVQALRDRLIDSGWEMRHVVNNGRLELWGRPDQAYPVAVPAVPGVDPATDIARAHDQLDDIELESIPTPVKLAAPRLLSALEQLTRVVMEAGQAYSDTAQMTRDMRKALYAAEEALGAAGGKRGR